MNRAYTNVLSGLLFLFALTMVPAAVIAHEGDHHDKQATARVLGNIDFPTTTNLPQAQTAFIEGMLLLHLFEYPFAQEKFQEAQQLDPGFVMACWGEAMTHNHPIWDQQDAVAALAILNKLGPSAEARQSRGRHLIILNRSGHSLTEKTPPE